ncbi:SRPBCC family protein [Leptospira ellisii]|uniref:Polyketide cyclase n=1 Tax=Leptospira ellisii TaxID=2023197 RepID=A0A2N0BBW9_9LEPT|nr:SRPBCC family protein [Leptospira ellisii]MDV6235559.1 SRPBCC family protein [Leptospira ellisii]PJZ94062.1 polyketide cyclase [Leptospira ellisii]PKA05858.1 polyketide cyclase [Leptospira ellisii]
MFYSILIYGFGFIAVAALTVYGVGSILPVEHTSSLEKFFPVPPKTVYALIRNVKEYPSWRPNLKQIEEISSVSWKETDSHKETMTYSFVQDQKDRLIESKIMDEDKPFGGSWTFELIPVEEGVKLRITENGKVFSPVFRFFSKYVFGHTATIRAYLGHMERRINGS